MVPSEAYVHNVLGKWQTGLLVGMCRYTQELILLWFREVEDPKAESRKAGGTKLM